jgi:asparagine synthase (glutamine-hydrolysing)
MEILDVFYDIFDEPHGDSSAIATTFVSELAKAHGVKVVLSADAGDELFGGYGRYPEFYQRWSQLQRLGKAGRALGRGLLKVGAALSGAERAERFGRVADLLVEQPFIHFMQRRIRCAGQDDYRAIFPLFQDGLTGGVNDNELLDQMCEWDFKRYMVDDILVKVDRATMYHSIEGREPLLDHRLVEFAAQLPSQWKLRNGETKYILKKLLARYLPEPLFRLPKRGFSAPLSQWIERHYRDRFVQVLQDGNDLFNRKQLGDMLDRYRQGKPVNYTLLWYLFSFQCWHNHWREPDIHPDLVKSA